MLDRIDRQQPVETIAGDITWFMAGWQAVLTLIPTQSCICLLNSRVEPGPADICPIPWLSMIGVGFFAMNTGVANHLMPI